MAKRPAPPAPRGFISDARAPRVIVVAAFFSTLLIVAFLALIYLLIGGNS